VNIANTQTIDKEQITNLVLDAIRDTNQLRVPELQIGVSENEPLFGWGGILDSLSLVALLLDIEELVLDKGFEVSLSSEDAMSQAKSPYRDVSSLVDYISQLLAQDS
jgi:acyl carrier protein